jgi:hypothetical protein
MVTTSTPQQENMQTPRNLMPNPQAVTAGSGLSVMPGGNLLGGRFLDSDPSNMSIRFSVPPEPGFTLDFGDGSPVSATDGKGFVDHAYAPLTGQPHPWVFTAALTDNSDGRWRGYRRFELPRSPYGPWSLAANSF